MSQVHPPFWRKKEQTLIDFERPDILVTCEALGITDLERHGTEAEGYYHVGRCPLHDAVNNHTCFCVWERVQKFTCHSCLEGKRYDVIDLYKMVTGCTFSQAVEKICSKIDSKDALLRKLSKQADDFRDDKFFVERVHRLTERMDFGQAYRILCTCLEARDRGELSFADNLLSRYGF